jgi:hypothetical protein
MIFSVLALIALPALAADPPTPGDHIRSLMVGDQDRPYTIHIPPSYDPKMPMPVVLALHSAAMNGATMARFCGLNQKADRSGFVVAYPNGTGSTPLFLYWDAGGVRGRASDDVGYVAKLLDDLEAIREVFPRKTEVRIDRIRGHLLNLPSIHQMRAIRPIYCPLSLGFSFRIASWPRWSTSTPGGSTPPACPTGR